MPYYLLTESEIALLQRVIDRELNRTINPSQQTVPAFDSSPSPETYIAWPPSGGIPALTLTGAEGPDGGADQPGSAACDIYKIDDSGTPELAAISGLDKTVYNLSTNVIPREWTIVTRTKGGRWIALAGQTSSQARWLKFSATEDFTSGETNVTIDGITYYDGTTPDPEPTSVENPGWGGLDNDVGIAFLNTDDNKYYITSMITTATDIMIGHRIDTDSSKKFETLWQQFYTRAAESTPSDWRTDHTGADCS